MIEIRLHVIPLTNEEKDAAGNPLKPYSATPAEFSALIGRVNALYASAGIEFVFDPVADWAPRADTELNTDGPDQRSRANAIAAGFPGKMVCLLRWGNDPSGNPTGNGNAYPPPGAGPKPPHVGDVVQNYVALPNRVGPGFQLLNQGNGSFVAHEFGHYLGLYHTFPGWTSRWGPIFGSISGTLTKAKADQAVIDYIAANGGTLAALDGDGVGDTPPDPSPALWNAHGTDVCSSPTLKVEGTLGGSPVSFLITPDPSNIMSYFGGCPPITTTSTPMHFSAQQIARMHATLEHPSRSHLLRRPWSHDEGGALLLLLDG